MAAATTRRSAEERRGEIVEIAISHFALHGYNGTSTDQVAREAGISQPYLFRLFGTKRELFLACHEVDARADRRDVRRGGARASRRRSACRRWATPTPTCSPTAPSLLFQMQSYAACADPEIQARVRERYADLVRQVAEATGAEPARAVVVLRQRDAAQRHRRAEPRGARAERGVGRAAGSTRTTMLEDAIDRPAD